MWIFRQPNPKVSKREEFLGTYITRTQILSKRVPYAVHMRGALTSRFVGRVT